MAFITKTEASAKGPGTTLLLVTLVLVVFSAPGSVDAKSVVAVDEFQVSKFVTTVRDNMKLPSVAVGIVGPKKSYYLQAYGEAEVTQPFMIGSLTQSMTALGVMLLVEDGKVALADPASKYVPDVPDGVFVRDLLEQTSGLATAAGAQPWLSPQGTLRDWLSVSAWGPRGSYAHSELNYAILGAVIEKASGEPFAKFMKARVWEPAGMKATRVGYEEATTAKPHQYVFGFPIARPEPEVGQDAAAALSVASSAEDMQRWLRILLNGGVADSGRIAKADTIKALLGAQEGTHSMGWAPRALGDVKALGQSGLTGAFSASMLLVPERHFGVVVLTNVNSFRARTPEGLAMGLGRAVVREAAEPVDNVEFVARLALGAIFAFSLLGFFVALMNWLSWGRPLRPSARRAGVAIILTGIQVGAVVALVVRFEATPLLYLQTQPDLALGIFGSVGLGTLGTWLNALRKSRMDAGPPDMD